ncbi:hypothetical protein EDC04DRAFT_2870455 [Pisolithus marmoratus]|nr:hypothetical protein EDC04DRAFT_2870455 [Pisolithus marmoratus]
MAAHQCSYCLKPIATAPGVKWHIAHTGHFTREFAGVAAKILGSHKMLFKSLEEVEIADKSSMWAPFHDGEEWELAHFLMKNVGQTKTDEFLKLGIVHNSGVSFNTAWSLLKKVDSLCTGPAWTCEIIDVVGDVVGKDSTLRHEQLELWQRDPMECMEELIGNPVFQDVMAYVPEHVYADAQGEKCIYDEMWTGDWWWDVQMKLPEGTVVAPVILSSDKTSLSVFSGDKKAWLVYLTIRNISKDVRCQVSVHAMVLIGYLPVSKLECFQKKTRSLAGYRLFHHVMSLVLQPLIDASRHGKEMVLHPILAAYVANFPEQCLVACNKESQCPCCLVESDKCGDLEECTWQSMMDTLKTLQHKQRNKQSRKFDMEGLCVDLPFSDIFTCITPDILHQLHKGIFHNHLLQWCMNLMGEKEIDAHFQAISCYPALRHFKKGISTISQEMQCVFDEVLLFQQQMDTTLEAMQESLKMFHSYKHVLVEMEVHQDFNLPKLHSLQHYATSIRALGSADGYNAEYPEQLHIDYAKDAYWASNK